MNLYDRNSDGCDRIRDRVRVMGVRAGVDNNCIVPFARLVERIDQFALSVMLFAANGCSEVARGGGDYVVDVRKRLGTVNVGFAVAKQVQVWAVQDENA